MTTDAVEVKSRAQLSDARNKDRFPNQIKYIVSNEACERYSFYGMRSILTIFMLQYLLFTETHATRVYHAFLACAYLTPLLGGYISDRYLGKYKTIIALSIVYCIGHLVLAIWENQMGLYWGLGLIALGAGGIKPCVSAHVGDQFTQSNKHLIKKVFDLFYWLINFGSFFSTLITPWVLSNYGPGWAFGIPGILMAIATFIFWMGRKQYVHVPPTGKNPHSPLKVIWSAFKNKSVDAKSFLDRALPEHGAEHVDAVKAVFNIGKVFIGIIMFWALFDQHGSTWILQAREMNLTFMGIEFLPSQIAALNPIMVMVLIPVFSFFVFPTLRKMGVTITPLRKMSVGMVITGFSFVQVAFFQYLLDKGVQLNIGWHFFPYITITVAELLVSITGLEFAYTQAPRSMRSTIMSIFFLTIFLGNMLTAFIASVNVFEGPSFFLFFGVLTMAWSGLFIFMASRYKMQDFVEKG